MRCSRGKSPSSAALSAYLRVRYEGYSRRASVEAARQKLTHSATFRLPTTALRRVHFAERELWDIGAADDRSQSGLRSANLITLAHFSMSSAMSLPYSTGELANDV
jgi:hypothetical protein